jgi:argininosuccinate lyase
MTSKPIWHKPDSVVDPRIMRFLAGQDVLLDRELMPYDIRASKAHAQGLGRIGVLGDGELAEVERALDDLARAFADGSFVLDQRHEDGQSAIEAWLADKLGDTGRKIHTGRSRNDQVLVASRLYLKDRLEELRPNSRASWRLRSVAPSAKRRCPCRATPTCSAPSSPPRACGGPRGPRASSTTSSSRATRCP